MKRLLPGLLLLAACLSYGQSTNNQVINTPSGNYTQQILHTNTAANSGDTHQTLLNKSAANFLFLFNNYEFVAAQAALPFVLPSSGSIGNNGALTLTTALPTTYANGYMYFPAGAIQSGSAAGVYFVQMSSTTVGTIYNNIYTTGQPEIPATPTAFASTGPGAYTQTTATHISLMVAVVPANTMLANGSITTEWFWISPSNTNNKTTAWMFDLSQISADTETTAQYRSNAMTLVNAGITNSQVSMTGANIGTGTGVSRTPVDTTIAKNVALTATLSVATDYIVIESYSVKVQPRA